MPGVTLRRPGIPVGPGAWDWAYLWVPALGLGIPVGPGACGWAYLWVLALETGHTYETQRLWVGTCTGVVVLQHKGDRIPPMPLQRDDSLQLFAHLRQRVFLVIAQRLQGVQVRRYLREILVTE
jgi:hypothetical protein